ncbi:MAG: cytochrome c peroxidase [Bacteroidota bacterium]
MKTNFSLLTTILVCLFLASCVDDAVDFEEFNYRPEDYNILTQTLDLPENPFEYTVELPSYMTRTGLFARPISDNRATLGRVLFYDKSLSHNKSLSCAGCHKQELAFADNRKFSLGFKGEETERNSLALGSVVSFAAYYGATSRAGLPFFWDERASSVSVQSLATLTNNVEMGMTRSDIVSAVKEKEYYRVLFEAAYRDAEITEERILLALESFVDGIGSYESKLDKAIEAEGDFFNIEENLRGLSTQENRGKAMFIQNCGSCHGRELARPGMPSANNGLDLRYADKGMGLIYGSSQFNGVFKVPALRNVEVTGPYMHDGRFESLEEVLDFYSEGIQNHTNLNPFLREENGSPKRFNFSQQDKDDIISFLRTLTDHEMMSYEKYSNPFK